MNLRIRDWYLSLDRESTPQVLVLEVSTRCNLQCIHCFRQASRSLKHRDMDIEEYRSILRNAIRNKIERLVFSGWGEPTVNPFILDMIEEAKANGLYVVLNTNGQNLEEIASELVKTRVDEVYVSIDAVDPDTYKMIRIRGELDPITMGLGVVNTLKKKLERRKPIINSIFTINRLNVDEVDRIIDYAVELEVENLYLSFYIPHTSGDASLSCLNDPECLRVFKEKIHSLSIRLMNTPIKLWLPNTDSYSMRECPFARSKALYIRVDGKVTPCSFLAYSWSVVLDKTHRRIWEQVIGDALNEDIGDVWRRNFKVYFKLFFNYMPSCLDCNLRNYCSYTLSSEMDCYGNSPNCSFCPYHYKFSFCPL